MVHFSLPFFNQSKEYCTLDETERKSLYKKIEFILTNHTPIQLTQKEQILVHEIKKETQNHNINNVTRTNAYIRFFDKHKEVHWAFLAHMVSRNGGFNMTDLKGSVVGKLISPNKKEMLFHFLERANALIFHDAYPQLLLYERSKQENLSFFHLLPFFHVSKFMIPIWNYFLISGNSKLLTLALITNEQNYVEKHLISIPETKETVFQTITYILQENLGLTQVIFPYKRYPFLKKYSLAGIEIRKFYSLTERIRIGKQLYSLLFSPSIFPSTSKFAYENKHTASRSDYWPHLFTKEKIKQMQMYSPILFNAWNDVSHRFPLHGDWCSSITQVKDFDIGISLKHTDITKNVKRDLKLLNSLVSFKENIFLD